jgi:hypothetical protein
MINLYYNYYVDKLKERNEELNYCLNKNINNYHIDNIYVMLENKDLEEYKSLFKKQKKIKTIIIEDRPTYKTFFDYCNTVTKNDDINIIINSDCFLDVKDTITLNKLNNNIFLCLSRWNIESLIPFKVNDKGIWYGSQDCWIWRGYVKDIKGNYKLGIKGCDNSIANQIKNTGYETINCPHDIKVYHYHFTYPNRIRETWKSINYDKEVFHFVQITNNYFVNKKENTILVEKKQDEGILLEKNISDNINLTIKNLCEKIMKNNEDIIIYHNKEIVYNSLYNKKEIQFDIDFFVIDNKTYSYRNTNIKKIK